MPFSKQDFLDFPLEQLVFAGQFVVPVAEANLGTEGNAAVKQVVNRIQDVFPGVQPTVDRDDGGDWEIVSKLPDAPRFRLDLGTKFVGAFFQDVKDRQVVLDVARFHSATSFETLSSQPRDLLIQFQTVLRLADGVTNHTVLEQSLIPGLNSSPFAKVLSGAEDCGRFDIRFSLDLDEVHRAVISVEMPANEDYSTVWFELTVMTSEEKPLQNSAAAHVDSILSVASSFYEHGYADFVAATIGNREVRRDQE